MKVNLAYTAHLAAMVQDWFQQVNAARTEQYASNAMSAITTLNDEFYNIQTGIWDDAWWNSANVLTMLADFTDLRLNDGNSLNIGGFMINTFIQAQKENVLTHKEFGEDGMVSSAYCIDDNSGCMTKRDSVFLAKRGFDDFINEFYDDEGWWALGLIRTYDVTREQKYLDAAIQIFNDMQTGLGGPCNGGIYWNKDRKYVNAITNELYLFVAASLASRSPHPSPERKRYVTIARDQWRWFKNSGMINKDNLINDGLDDNCNNNGLQTWSYNQGVILGGLTELFRGTRNRDLLEEAHVIAGAAIKHLSNEDGVLVETDKCELRAGNCGRDGQQFKGIFIRNLRYLHDEAPRDQYRDFILKNADVIWAENNQQNMLGPAWHGPYLKATGASQSCALDVIVAAIAVAGT